MSFLLIKYKYLFIIVDEKLQKNFLKLTELNHALYSEPRASIEWTINSQLYYKKSLGCSDTPDLCLQAALERTHKEVLLRGVAC